jgi:hypothetical protein
MTPTSSLSSYVSALRGVFTATTDKHAAHNRARPILQDMAAARPVFAEVVDRHLRRPDALSIRHYPVVSFDIESSNPHFGLVANCWIPLPDGTTNMSTKAIHHHGDMLLTTVTAFGPGYEHWTFTSPELVDADRDLFSMRLLDRAPHPEGHADFVDANIGHVPFYPPALTVTYALWSSRKPTSWKDRVKRVPALHRHSRTLRGMAASLGLRGALDLKIVEYFDFFPSDSGFHGMKAREEFGRGPVADYLCSLFHIIQRTGNQHLGSTIRQRADSGSVPDAALVARLLNDLDSGRPIAGRLSEGHYNIPFANFTGEAIERGLAASAALSVAHN